MSAFPDPASLSDHEMAQLMDAVAEVEGWLDLKLKTGRYSFGLAMELARHALSRASNVHAIYDEIGKLEGSDTRPTLTKREEPFRGEVLRGLWHKHHQQTCFLVRNLTLEAERTGVVRDALAPYIGRDVDEVAGEIAHALVIGMYGQRARESRVTGEWIVFEKVDGANYYLTLGSHNERDERTRTRVDKYRKVDDELAAARQGACSSRP
jgi:hypothetical protein